MFFFSFPSHSPPRGQVECHTHARSCMIPGDSHQQSPPPPHLRENILHSEWWPDRPRPGQPTQKKAPRHRDPPPQRPRHGDLQREKNLYTNKCKYIHDVREHYNVVYTRRVNRNRTTLPRPSPSPITITITHHYPHHHPSPITHHPSPPIFSSSSCRAVPHATQHNSTLGRFAQIFFAPKHPRPGKHG